MQSTKLSLRKTSQTTVTNFERITRQIRWLYIVCVLVSFPSNAPQATFLYVLIAAATLYNISRYVFLRQRSKYLSSPLNVLVADTIIVGLLIALVGNVSTPYSAFLVFLIIICAFQYEIKTTLVFAVIQTVGLYIIATHPLFKSIWLGQARTVLIIGFALVTLGLLIERLTRMERKEKNQLKKLSTENEIERLLLLNLVNSLDDAIFVVDSRRHVSHHNHAAVALLDTNQDITGQLFADVLQVYERTKPGSKPVDILENSSGFQHRRDLNLIQNNNITIDLDINVRPVKLHDKKTTDYIVVCKDITNERTLEEQRSAFISVASHELRTPITIMEAALSLVMLSKDKLPDQVSNVIEQAHRNAVFLGGIVKDLSILAEAKNDRVPIQLEQVEPDKVVSDLVSDFKAQANQKELKLMSAVDPKTPNILSTEQHIYEILQNFIINSLKYTNQGHITISAIPTKDSGVQFSVEDSGIGISPADQKHLFTKFFRVEDYKTRETGGSGLGLYLCMELAQRIGAKIWCESTLNKGSTFYLQIPPFSHLQRDQTEVVKAQVANLVDDL